MESCIPDIGSIWRHYTGSEYIVVDVTNENNSTTIHYKPLDTISTRKIEDWYKTVENQMVKKFRDLQKLMNKHSIFTYFVRKWPS
jgi:FlaG/FlaF family flagellin (archaellin)